MGHFYNISNTSQRTIYYYPRLSTMSFNSEQRQKLTQHVQDSNNNKIPKTYFDLVEKVGDSGKYQLLMLIIFLIMWFITGIILLSYAFLFRSKVVDCKANGLLISSADCLNYVCKLPETEWEKFYAHDDNDFQSLATDPEYLCEKSAMLDLISSSVYFGAFIGYITISFFSDNFGRRSSILISWGICTIGTIVVALSFNIWMVAVGLFLCGCGSDAGINIVFFFFGEMVGNQKRQKYSVFVQVFFCVGAMTVTLFFYLIDDWRINWIILVTGPAIVELALLWYYIEETPQFLVKKGVNPTLKAMNRIGKMNKNKQSILDQEDVQNVMGQQQTQSYQGKYITPIDLCRFPSLRVITICGSMISFMTYALYYGPTLIIDDIGFNIYITNIMINLSELLTFLPAYLFIEKIQRRKWGIILLFITSLCALTLTFVKKPQGQDFSFQAVIQLIVVFIFRACVSFFFIFFQIYIVELFPSRAVGMGAGIVAAFGTLASTSSPIYIGYLKRNNINVMTFFILFAIIGIGNLILLTETKGVALKEEIEEIELAKEKNRSHISGKGSKIHSFSSQRRKSQITEQKTSKSNFSRAHQQ